MIIIFLIKEPEGLDRLVRQFILKLKVGRA